MSRYFPRSIEETVRWYERYISPLALVVGFLVDNFLLLTRIDTLQTHLVFFFYLTLIAVCIVSIHFVESGRMRNQFIVRTSPLIPVVMQFVFGNLFSGYLALYSRSASLAVGWIFVFILAVLLIGNERFTRLYTRFTFQIGLYFTTLFSFLIFFLPVVLHRIGHLMFLMSGVMSLLVIGFFLWLLYHIVPEIVRKNLQNTLTLVIVILCSFNILYFSNIIPPLPLALKEAGVYHSVTRKPDGNYQLLAEPVPWYESYLRYNTKYHAVSGEGVYVYSSIFAPSGLSTTILNEWQRYDSVSGEWVSSGTLRFVIVGGRASGYRGYSFKSSPTEGKWRVNVITEYGQLIGRISFTVVGSSSTVPFITLIR